MLIWFKDEILDRLDKIIQTKDENRYVLLLLIKKYMKNKAT